MLGDLENQADGVVLDLKSVEDGGEILVELDIDDGTDDGPDLAIRNSGRLSANFQKKKKKKKKRKKF